MDQRKGGWRDALDAAKQRVDEFAAADPRAKKVLDGAKTGVSAAGKTLDSTRRKVTQEQAWAEVSDLLEEVVDVLIVQSKVIDGLVEQLAALEAKSEAHES